jgi:hypothetical protein
MPIVAQHFREEPLVRGRGEPVHRVVRRHDGARAALLDCGLEGRKVFLVEQPFVDVDRIAVAPSVGDVRYEMLGRGHDAHLFERTHKGERHRSGEPRIFAVRLLDAPPANVVRDVDHGGEHLPHAARPRFGRDRRRNARHQRRVPSGGESDHCRKRGRADSVESVHGLFERNDRYSEARAVDEEVLHRIQFHRHPPRGGAGIGVARRVTALAHLEPEHAVLIHSGAAVEIAGHHPELPELLFRRHAREQVADAGVNRQRGISVRPALRAKSRGAAQQRNAQKQESPAHQLERFGIAERCVRQVVGK